MCSVHYKICENNEIEKAVVLCKKIKDQINVIICNECNKFQSKYNSSLEYQKNWKEAEIVDHYCCDLNNYYNIKDSMFDNLIIIYNKKMDIKDLLLDNKKNYYILCSKKDYKNLIMQNIAEI